MTKKQNSSLKNGQLAAGKKRRVVLHSGDNLNYQQQSITDKPFFSYVRDIAIKTKESSTKQGRKKPRNGTSPLRVVLFLLIGIYLISLPYSIPNSPFHTTVCLYLTCGIAICYTLVLSRWYVKMIPLRIKYCALRKQERRQKKRQQKIKGKQCVKSLSNPVLMVGSKEKKNSHN